jgi:membrane-associated phospholipid phosphatase
VGTSWYLDVNRLARKSHWAHGFMAAYAEKALSPVGAGLLVLAVLIILAWLVTRYDPDRMVGVAWAGLGAFVALGVQQAVAPVLDQPRPYHALRHVLLLVPASGSPLPDARTAMAGAVVAGLLIARRRWLGSLALLAALLLAFARVYVGADYPADVAAGLGLGATIELALWPLCAWLVRPSLESLAGSRLGVLVSAGHGRQKRSRQPVAPKLGQARMPNERVMDALRAASEAARHGGNSAPPKGATQTDSAGSDASIQQASIAGAGQHPPSTREEARSATP